MKHLIADFVQVLAPLPNFYLWKGGFNNYKKKSHWLEVSATNLSGDYLGNIKMPNANQFR